MPDKISETHLESEFNIERERLTLVLCKYVPSISSVLGKIRNICIQKFYLSKNSNLDVYPIFFPLNEILTHSSDVFIIQVSDKGWLYGEGKPFFSSISAIHSCRGSRAQLAS